MTTTPPAHLVHGADLARRVAPELCARSGQDCAWYHGAWPLWRALGLGTNPTMHSDFFYQAVSALPRVGRPRVLVSGAADHAMPVVASQAFRVAGANPRITVLDHCETPLALARSHAERLGLVLDTTACDVLRYRPDEPFHVVCTHGFLGYFDAAGRRRLARAWRGQLHRGGSVLLVNRLRPDAPAHSMGFSESQATAFVAAASARARDLLPDEAPLRVERLARAYTSRFALHPIRSPAELAGPLEEAGFEVSVRTEPMPARPGGPTGPATPGDAVYALVVATAC